MSSKLLSLYSSWREKKQYSTQISQNETTNNDSFDILIEEEQRKSIEINQKLINEEEINLDYNFEFPEITVDTSFEKQRKKRLFTSLFKFFTISLSILLILFICTLIIFLSLIFISHYNQPIHITIIDNTELNEQHADYEFYDVYFGEYPSINLSENETNIPFKPHSFTKDESKDIIEFFAVSDFHLDISYDSNKVCKNQGEQDKRQRGDTNNYKLGQYQCDSPEDLLKSFTGDIVKHGDLEKTEYLETFDRFKTNYLKYFPDTLFLPVVGNHDFYPRKSYVEIKENNENLAEIADAITFSLPPSAVETFKQGGFYSYLLPSPSSSDENSSSTLLISLNNIIYSPDWMKGCKKVVGSTSKCKKQRGSDPFGQFDWLHDQLKYAQKSGLKVMIAMHYGMGTSRGGDLQWEDSFQTTFIDLLTKYQDTITTIISGHSHRDLFRLLPNFLKNKIAVLENSSLTPIDGANPSFRYMYLNSTTSQIIDYQHAFFNLSSYISKEIGEIDGWKMEYEFEKQFNVKPTPQGYIHIYNELLISEFDSDNFISKFLYNQIVKYYPTSSPNSSKISENELLCSISNILNADSGKCLETNTGDNNKDNKELI